MHCILSDVRYAARQLRHAPAFTIAVVLTLVLAIGANTAIFSVVRAVLLQPLPYPEADRLLALGHGEGSSWYSFSYPRYQFLRARLDGAAGLAAYDDETVTFIDGREPERLEGGRVSANFFGVLGVRPALGRGFLPAEDRHGADAVALLSDPFWRRRYSADPHVIGRSVTIDGEPFTIVGIMPRNFQFLGVPVDVWRSRMVDTRTFTPADVQAGAAYLTVIARLRPGATLAQFRAALPAAAAEYRRNHPGNSDVGRGDRDDRDSAAWLQQKVYANIRPTLLVLWGAVACLLAIACANIINLVLERAAARRRDIEVRFALGATRARIAQQLMVENILLALLGAGLSLPVSSWAMRYITAALQRMSQAIPEVRVDTGLMLFSFALATAMGTLFGLIPMWPAGRGGPRLGERAATASRWSGQLRAGIVVAQVALCLVLLAGAGLLLGSFVRMTNMRSGMRSDHVAMFPLDLMPERYRTRQQRSDFYNEVIRRIGTIPGVRAAGISSRVDFVNPGLGYKVWVEGAQDNGSKEAGAHGRSVSADYFRVVGIPLLRGRGFNEHDTTNSPPVMIVNQAFVRRFFPNTDPIGKHVAYSSDRTDCEVVGVVADVRAGLQYSGADDEIYVPLAQRPWLVARLVVRTDGPAEIAAAIRQRVRSVDPEQAVSNAVPLDQLIADRLGRPRSTMLIVSLFATSALLLATVGIYGVIAYSVAQRRKEIGIRMALGADSGRVRTLIFGQTIRLVGAGLAIGLPLSQIVGRYYSSLLFEVQPGDPAIMACAVAALLAAAFAATHFPSSRAAKLDPLIVLRND